MQHALGLPTTSQLDPVAGSVQWRYQFEHDALEEVIEFVEVSASCRCCSVVFLMVLNREIISMSGS